MNKNIFGLSDDQSIELLKLCTSESVVFDGNNFSVSLVTHLAEILEESNVMKKDDVFTIYLLKVKGDSVEIGTGEDAERKQLFKPILDSDALANATEALRQKILTGQTNPVMAYPQEIRNYVAQQVKVSQLPYKKIIKDAIMASLVKLDEFVDSLCSRFRDVSLLEIKEMEKFLQSFSNFFTIEIPILFSKVLEPNIIEKYKHNLEKKQINFYESLIHEMVQAKVERETIRREQIQYHEGGFS